jgi:hypothetical protein
MPNNKSRRSSNTSTLMALKYPTYDKNQYTFPTGKKSKSSSIKLLRSNSIINGLNTLDSWRPLTREEFVYDLNNKKGGKRTRKRRKMKKSRKLKKMRNMKKSRKNIK